MSRYHGRYETVKPKKKKRVGLILLVVLLVLLAVAAAAGFVYYNSVLNKMNHVEVEKIDYAQLVTEASEPEETEGAEDPTEAITVPATEPAVATSEDFVNFLVVGQAGRVGETERFADSMILVTVNKFDKTVTLTSMLRDSFVKPPNYKGHEFGRIKLTTVYHLGSFYTDGSIAGSMELMNMTLFRNFGIEVDHNFEVDFDIFVKTINTIGGISLELTEAEANYLNKEADHTYQTVTPGKNCLYGGAALAYARMRKAEGDADSDIVRTERQRKLVEAVFKELRRMSISELQELVNAVLPMITTSMTNAEITDMMVTMLPMISELTIQKGGTCPANTKGDMVDIYKDGMLHSILRFDEVETTKHMRAITEGEIIPEPATVQ